MALPSPGPELSSITTALEDLSRRVSGIAEAATDSDADWVASDLFEVERSLGEAVRRLGSVGAKLRRRQG